MNKLGKLIAALLVVGIGLFIVVQFIIIPKQNAAAEQYVIDQRRPLTHDLENIIPYRFLYMGNAGNMINLFNHLPLNEVEKDFELKSEAFTLIVNYHQSVSEIGTNLVNQSLIYNSTAAFALIGNLEKIEYNFPDQSFEVKRERIKSLYDDFSQLIKSNRVWNQQVRNPLKDKDYTDKSIESILKK
ncbi:DUF4825 domain-containing protein [Neobacillus novalis]|uniref:DUF4825 domain-containing protein n=1 Tax=Neobacillus novalis TaxID=220687 RepID=A0AA95MSY4_9BACI|nr:DUF4825 domain-containing protein [Neobacillus novalis]WHY87218.1 DUF4825 domain-containing protein [Neobacillus novalis]